MVAVQQDGRALQYAPDFRRDPDIACAAVRNNPQALDFIDKSLDSNDDFIECMIKYKIRRIGRRPVLQDHIRERLKLTVVEKSPHDTMRYEVRNNLGGKRRRTRKSKSRLWIKKK